MVCRLHDTLGMNLKRQLALFCLIIGLSSHALGQLENTLVISDVDHTIQHTQVRPTNASIIQRLAHSFWLFPNTLKNHDAFVGMSQLYMMLAVRGAQFHYVSGAIELIQRLPNKFLQTTGFPVGQLWLRPGLNVPTEDFKFQKIKEILDANPDSKVILVGDNGEKDVSAYRRLQNDPRYGARIIFAFIHDLYPQPIGEKLAPGQQPYLTSADLALQLHNQGLLGTDEVREITALVEQGLLSDYKSIRHRAFPNFANLREEHLNFLKGLGQRVEDKTTKRSLEVIIDNLSKRLCSSVLL